VANELQTSSPVFSAGPIPPKQRRGTNHERVQQDTHSTRLCGGGAIPLALLTQWTGAATADAGSIHDTQTPIDFSALFMREQFLVSRTPECPIRLERKVLARKATRFPGASPREGEQNLREEPCAVKEEGEQEQIRSCGSDQGEADAPVRV
jgi:hypothetical protein